MNSASSFKEFFESNYQKELDQLSAQKLSKEFFADFIHFTPLKLELLESYLNTGHIDYFYQSLTDLKYLIEFSDDFNRYWHLLRAYSGGLAKLKANQSVKGSKKLYPYYFDKYGDRRMLRNEHWFEKKRWEFLDELASIFSEDELEAFILKYQKMLADNLNVYIAFVQKFVQDLQYIQQHEELVN